MKELWMLRKGFGKIMRAFGAKSVHHRLCRPVVAVRYGDIVKVATWLVAKRYGIYGKEEPVLSPTALEKITERLVTKEWCHYHKFRDMTPSQIKTTSKLLLLSEEKRIALLAAITKFEMEVENLAERIWETLRLVAVEPPELGTLGEDDGIGRDGVQVRGGGNNDDGGSGVDTPTTEEGTERPGDGEGDYQADAEYLGEFAAGGSH